VLAFLALAVVANAHWTHDESLAIEIGPPPGETMPGGHVENSLEMIQESAGADATTYRITVGTIQATEQAANTNSPWSIHKFQMQIIGTNDKKTGWKDLRYYAPSMAYSQASGAAGSNAPEFHPGMKPLNCEPNTEDCGKALSGGTEVKYKGNRHGIIQHVQLETTEAIGELKGVEIKEVLNGEEPDGWQPAFIKINANDMKTGLGAGVYYINPNQAEIRGDNQQLKAQIPNQDGSAVSGKIPLTRCNAQFCEEEMDTKLGL
jgi:hypothetical protein